MEIIIVNEPVEPPPDPPPATDSGAVPDLLPSIETERRARLTESAATSARISSLEAALLVASSRAARQLEAFETLRRRRRVWLRAAALLIVAGVVWQAFRNFQALRGPAPGESRLAQSKPAESSEANPPKTEAPPPETADSALRRFARLPARVESGPETSRLPPPLPPGELALAAERLSQALEVHPQQSWPQILDHVRETSGRSVCPFLWIDGSFAFLLPDAPLGIRSLPSAMSRCAEAVAAVP